MVCVIVVVWNQTWKTSEICYAFYYCKGRVRVRARERCSTCWRIPQTQQAGLSQAEASARNFIPVSYMVAAVQVLGSSSAAFWDHNASLYMPCLWSTISLNWAVVKVKFTELQKLSIRRCLKIFYLYSCELHVDTLGVCFVKYIVKYTFCLLLTF